MCPGLFKGSHCLLGIGLALRNLLCVAALSREAVLRVLLAMCGVVLVGMALYVHLMVYMGLSLFIIRRANVYLVVCILTRITLHWVHWVIIYTMYNLLRMVNILSLSIICVNHYNSFSLFIHVTIRDLCFHMDFHM